ncbi:hypothetical protein MRS44_004323 [Fusarium solani]|uniref:uncharacterized protein n=1 Tax=Fusarium solani TaxID=169388 RepID=UPI0032C42333|nr:hypothetical protein MRS44_004323 [Fusarium solani]
MKDRAPKAQTLNTSKPLSMRSRGAPFDEEKYINRPDTAVPPTQRDAVLLQAMKGQPDITSETHPPPMKRSHLMQAVTQAADAESASKRAGLSQASIQQFDVDQHQPSRATENTRQPKPLERPYSSLSEPKVEREDQLYPASLLWTRHNSNSEREHQPKRTRLTREALALFNKMGEEKGKRASAPAPLEAIVESSTTKTISTTMSGFAMQASRNGILDPLDSKPPVNLDDIRERHAQSRETASPTESAYEGYVKTVGLAPNEATMVVEVTAGLLKRCPDKGYYRAFNQAFTGLTEDAGFNNGLSAPQPDFVEGLKRNEFRPLLIEDHVDGAVLYKDNPKSMTLPHLAGEFKGPGKDLEKARLQSAYDGAALAYGRNQALNCIGKPTIAGHAKITTFTTDGTHLNLFAHYATPSEDGTAEYHQYPISSTNLKSSHQDFRQGYRQLRNAQDCAREESYKLRDQLKEHRKAKNSQPAPLPSIEDKDGCHIIDRVPIYQPAPLVPFGPKHGKASVSQPSHSIEASSPSAADIASSRGYKRPGFHRDRRGQARK